MPTTLDLTYCDEVIVLRLHVPITLCVKILKSSGRFVELVKYRICNLFGNGLVWWFGRSRIDRQIILQAWVSFHTVLKLAN